MNPREAITCLFVVRLGFRRSEIHDLAQIDLWGQPSLAQPLGAD